MLDTMYKHEYLRVRVIDDQVYSTSGTCYFALLLSLVNLLLSITINSLLPLNICRLS